MARNVYYEVSTTTGTVRCSMSLNDALLHWDAMNNPKTFTYLPTNLAIYWKGYTEGVRHERQNDGVAYTTESEGGGLTRHRRGRR